MEKLQLFMISENNWANYSVPVNVKKGVRAKTREEGRMLMISCIISLWGEKESAIVERERERERLREGKQARAGV